MYPLKQSTAIDVSIFVHDGSGDAVLGLVNGDFTKRIKKGSGAWGAMTVTITEEENGWYGLTISSAHANTVGLLSMTFIAAGAKQVNLQFRVTANLVDDVADKTANLPADPADASDLLALLTAIDDYIDTEVAAIKAKTDLIPASPAAVSDIPTAAAIADAVHDEDSGKLRSHLKTVTQVIIGAGSTSTVLQLDASTGINGGAPSSEDDFYKDQVIKFITGALAGQATSVSAYNGSTKRLTVVELTGAPSAADTAVME